MKKIAPILFCFFTMGFVDFVGTATNYAKSDTGMSDTMASTIPMMVFVWFAIFSIPSGLLMNRIGRKKTVLLSIVLTFVGLIIPLLIPSFAALLAAFALIGIGNTVLQTSLNPLVSNIVKAEKLTGALTFGQFTKAIASFIGPIVAAFAVRYFNDWKLAFAVFAAVTVISGIWLYMTQIPAEEKENVAGTSFAKTLAMLKDNYILLLFLGILAVVGIDVGLNVYIPNLVRTFTNGQIPLDEATYGTSVYFAARTAGAFTGAMILSKLAGNKFLTLSMIISIVAILVMPFMSTKIALFILIAVIGFACANVFSILFSYALQYKPEESNEISSLMIMGVAGGALFPFIMGRLVDLIGIWGSIAVFVACMLYIMLTSFKLKPISQ